MDRLALRLEKHHALPVVLFQPDLVHLQIHRLSLQSGWCWWWLWWILFTSIADNWTKYRIFVYCPVIRSVPQITIIPTLSMLSKSRKNKCREEYLFWAFGEIPFQQTRKFLSHYIWDSWTIGPLNAVCVSKSRYWTHFTSFWIYWSRKNVNVITPFRIPNGSWYVSWKYIQSLHQIDFTF